MANRRNQELTKREKRTLRRFTLAVIVLALLFLIFVPGRGLLTHRSLKKEVRTLAHDNKMLQQRNIELAEEIERLKNDEAYLEHVAREKYGLLKKNEEIYELKSSRTRK
jgi:cell division protein FtsB